MSKSTDVKSQQLGMPFGSANYTLTVMLLHQLIVKVGMDSCHRCGDKILTHSDLSKDHVVDWLHSADPVGLFFDLDNIRFSHKKCNTRRQQHGVRTKSGLKGVRFRKRYPHNPWEASISVGGIQKYIGNYPTEKEAAEAFDKASVEHFGSDAVTNRSLGLIL